MSDFCFHAMTVLVLVACGLGVWREVVWRRCCKGLDERVYDAFVVGVESGCEKTLERLREDVADDGVDVEGGVDVDASVDDVDVERPVCFGRLVSADVEAEYGCGTCWCCAECAVVGADKFMNNDNSSDNNGVISFKRGALRMDELGSRRLLNLDGEDLYPGFYAVQLMVPVEGEDMLMEMRVEKIVRGAVHGSGVAPTEKEVVHACAAVGDLVRIGVEGELPVGGAGAVKKEVDSVDEFFRKSGKMVPMKEYYYRSKKLIVDFCGYHSYDGALIFVEQRDRHGDVGSDVYFSVERRELFEVTEEIWNEVYPQSDPENYSFSEMCGDGEGGA